MGRSIAALLILLMTAAVGGCGGDEQPGGAAGTPATTAAPTPTTAATATTEPAVLADGRHPAYVKSVDPDGQTVTFDLIQFFSGDAATKAAAEDGEESPPPNDYYIRNVNPRLRTLAVRADAIVTVNSLGFGGQAERPVSLAKLATLTRPHDDWPPFWITVRHGQVVKIAQQWVP